MCWTVIADSSDLTNNQYERNRYWRQSESFKNPVKEDKINWETVQGYVLQCNAASRTFAANFSESRTWRSSPPSSQSSGALAFLHRRGSSQVVVLVLWLWNTEDQVIKNRWGHSYLALGASLLPEIRTRRKKQQSWHPPSQMPIRWQSARCYPCGWLLPLCSWSYFGRSKEKEVIPMQCICYTKYFRI